MASFITFLCLLPLRARWRACQGTSRPSRLGSGSRSLLRLFFFAAEQSAPSPQFPCKPLEKSDRETIQGSSLSSFLPLGRWPPDSEWSSGWASRCSVSPALTPLFCWPRGVLPGCDDSRDKLASSPLIPANAHDDGRREVSFSPPLFISLPFTWLTPDR